MIAPEITSLAILQRDPFRYITALKLLHAYGSRISCVPLDRDDAAGVLLHYPPAVFPYDGVTYPTADLVVLLATDNAAIAEELLAHLPPVCNPVFKLVDPVAGEVVARRFAVRRVIGFVSYTSPPNQHWPPVEGVEVTDRVDDALRELFVAQGHDRAELQHHFGGGGSVAFVIRDAGAPVAACYVFQNFGAIWEIAAVYTQPALRRGGYGRRVVAAALHYLAARNLTPRYQIHESNQPSVGLAESLGLVHFVTMEHFTMAG